ncbi:diguanylate cyclase with GAF sensor [Granulicella rosea]|uniref:diguanylate cyclase n=1 Tax=Granulicella rosea TaxID=474952 RepID=A0A239LRV1_9BACT|nr:sensor domain-containing diguanylate cyclase [Granulicella rosea]SNT33266.1 diguanylate cyclase with GAF sensor [Granulicella rosea]
MIDTRLSDPKLNDEQGRVLALQRYQILDTPREAPFDRIAGLVKAVMQVPIAIISLIDSERQWFKSCIGMGDTTETTREVSFCTHTIQAREPLYIPDARLDPRFATNPLVTGAPFIRSYVGVPLCTPDGYNVGSLCAIDTIPREYTPSQIEVLKSFAALAAEELELRRVAQIDFVTGAATRRGFTVEVDKAIARYGRYARSSALLVLDLDHFKKVNDTWGHAAGDAVLRAVGAKLNALLRATDVLGRLGGEEFGILLAEATLRDASRSAERFRKAIEAIEIENDPPIKVTASFGISAIGPEHATADQWLAEADLALYAAKRGGRNRSCIAPSSAETQLSRPA